MFAATLRNERFVFPDLRTLLAKANEPKSGDRLAGIAATSERERVAAKMALADVPLVQLADRPLIDPDRDEVSRTLLAEWDRAAFAPLRSLTVGEFREWLLDDATTGEDLLRAAPGLLPEMAAAACKLMGNKDLALVASKPRIVTKLRNTLGERGVFAVRVQPNHPTDDLGGILAATLDGLAMGCGDAVLGVNPAADSVPAVAGILHMLDRLTELLEIPTQACCLAHVTTQLACLEQGAPVDLIFQSVAGTEAANRSFGIDLALLSEAVAATRESHRGRPVEWVGDNVAYFETGQGSALSAEAHHGVDQLTCEARAQAVARRYRPLLVNSVVGFIGPEYLADERQILRAALEDHFMGKLMGLPMGCDICHTNHADADHNTLDNGLLLLAAAGCNFVMGVPAGDDVMLGYQTTSYHDAAAARRLFGLSPAPEFAAWLERRGLTVGGRLATADTRPMIAAAGRALP